MIRINEQEQDLEMPVSEYPTIDECKAQIKPFEELWGLVRDQINKFNFWQNSEL